MENKNQCIVNEAQTLAECVQGIMSQACRLTADNATVNAATIRSLYASTEALNTEVRNLSALLDGYAD